MRSCVSGRKSSTSTWRSSPASSRAASFQPPIFDDVDISLYVVKRRVEAAPLKLKLSVHEAIRFVEFSELLRMSIYEVTPATHHFAATMLRREMEAEYERVARVRR